MSDGEAGQRDRELQIDHRYAIRRVLSPPDELIDLSAVQREEALIRTIADYEAGPKSGRMPTAPSGPAIRRTRDPNQALLLIYVLTNEQNAVYVEHPMVGFFVSFPHSRHDIAAEYAVNEVWRQLQIDGLEYEEEDAEL